MALRVLAIEPYYGGSHKQFLDSWQSESRHAWTTLTLPAYKWKWRMRHSAVTMAREVRARIRDGETWDLVFASDMLGLSEFIGLTTPQFAVLPRIVYFHENQLTYPNQVSGPRDHHFGFTNITSALSADRVWFNSNYHREDFLRASSEFLMRMPDYQELQSVDEIRLKSDVQSPGIESRLFDAARHALNEHSTMREGDTKKLRIAWNARWEHDKRPDRFFEALRELKAHNVGFCVDVLGQSYRNSPAEFERFRRDFVGHIKTWGFVESRDAYARTLSDADVYVSTADHEFFGIGAVEAIAAGAFPLLPNRLAYPELLSTACVSESARLSEFYYDGTVSQLVDRLMQLAARKRQGQLWPTIDARVVQESIARYESRLRAQEMDAALEAVHEEFTR